MKLWKWMVRCPILFLLVFGWIVLLAVTYAEGKLPNSLDKEIMGTPVFTALLDSKTTDSLLEDFDEEDEENENDEEMQILADAGQISNQISAEKDAIDTSAPIVDTTNRKPIEKDTDPNSQQAGNTKDISDDETGITRFKKYKKKKTNSPYYSDPGKKALTTDYSYQEVDKSYFDHAVFIGDSRTVGMQDYSGLENATFFAKTGMNVYEVLEDKFIIEPKTGKEVSVAHMLKTYQYDQIYLMVGINELGTGNTGTFQKAYERVLKKFRKWQPDAVIYIQGIIPVSKVKASEDEIFNNVNINDKNVAIAQLADGKNIFYLDVSKKLTDKQGYLKADYTFDEVHMYAQYYTLWTEYLMKHAVVRK